MPNQLAPVRFHLMHSFALRDRRKLRAYLRELFKKEKKPLGSLDYIFCSDKYLLKINQDFLKHDFLTDIITFDLSESNSLILGEIYISVDRVRENSRLFNIPLSTEMKRVMFHGALHLCGYRDKSKPESEKMRIKEDYFLASYKRLFHE